jgi:uncharacterized membrane protein
MPSYASARNETPAQRVVRVFLLLSSVALLAGSIYRATWPFGFDESQSFASFNGRPHVLQTANHHPLNTLLMRWCSELFGRSELSLRLPNVLAHGLYLFSALALVRRVRNPALQVLGFVVLNLNLLVIEYFAVARGYGLALAFQLFSLFLLVRGCEEPAHRRRDLILSVAAGCLAVASNFAWVYYHVPLLAAAIWLLARDDRASAIGRRRFVLPAVLVTANAAFLSFILGRLLRLKRDQELFFGGQDGFISDTVRSLVRCSLSATMNQPAVVTTTATILVGSFLLVLLLAADPRRRKERLTLGLLVILLILAIVLPILGHRLLGALLPIERAALFYLPLYALVLMHALDAFRAGRDGSARQAAVLCVTAVAVVAAGWSFFGGLKEHSSCTWWVDTRNYNREVVELIQRDRAARWPTRPVSLRVNWRLEPSLYYYRKTRRYTWLKITAGPTPNPDYLYVLAAGIGTAGTTTLASYPDIGMVLLRANHDGGP